MPVLANELLPFLRDIDKVSGVALFQRLLQDESVGSAATESGLDVPALLESLGQIEAAAVFDNATFKEFERSENSIRSRISPEIERAGGAFPSWRLSGRCTPLAFAMLEGFAAPEFADYARALEKHQSVPPFTGTPVNTIAGLALYSMRLIKPHVGTIQGLDNFIQLLEED